MSKQNRTSSLSFLMLGLVILLCLSWIWQMNSQSERLDFSQVEQLFRQEKVESFTIRDNTLLMTLRGEPEGRNTLRYELYDFDLFYDSLGQLVEEQAARGVITSYDYQQDHSTNWLELLLPWREGLSLRQWLYEQNPTLEQRRDACLTLLEQQLELRGRLPFCLTVLAAAPENLVNNGTGLLLQYIPNLQGWEPGMTEAQAVRALAGVIYEVLVTEADWARRGRIPAEVRLLRFRQSEQCCIDWGQLQRDLTAIPDHPPRVSSILRARAQRAWDSLCRMWPLLLRVLAALLFAAALLSLAMAYRLQGGKEPGAWPGMPQVGDQDLRNGEDGG